VYAAADLRNALQSALATLPRRQRAVIVLRFFDDLTEAQAARVLNCSVGTIKSQTSRGLAKLRVSPVLGAPRTEEVAP
jgi:RNA polymerase sigma factor (sigma-70 family)